MQVVPVDAIVFAIASKNPNWRIKNKKVVNDSEE